LDFRYEFITNVRSLRAPSRSRLFHISLRVAALLSGFFFRIRSIHNISAHEVPSNSMACGSLPVIREDVPTDRRRAQIEEAKKKAESLRLCVE
jgi:hypothetical protein